MENDADSIRWLLIKAALECNDPELLDLVYKIIVSDKAEGRAD